MNLRYLWRSLSLVFVLWFALFPTLSYASETDYDVTTESAIQSDVPMFFSITPDEITSGYLQISSCLEARDLNDQYYHVSFNDFTTFIPPYTNSFQSSDATAFKNTSKKSNEFNIGMTIRSSDNTNIIDAGSVFDLSLTNISAKYTSGYSWSIVNLGGGSGYYEEFFDVSQYKYAFMYVFPTVDKDWSNYKRFDIYDCIITDTSNNSFSVLLEDIEAPFEIKNIAFSFIFADSADDLDSSKVQYASGFNGWNNGYYTLYFDESLFSVDIQDESVGLLNGIIEWLRSIRDGITGVKDGVTNVVNGITQLPSKLWTVMENGIKGLFVPSETDITSMKDKWDTLLSDRFGVVYESGALLIDIANSVQESSTKETISFPSVSYNFSGTEFTFGGYEVDVIPNGFEFLADILKGVIDIVCTLAFINAMRRKYDELMMR